MCRVWSLWSHKGAGVVSHSRPLLPSWGEGVIPHLPRGLVPAAEFEFQFQ